MTTEVESGLRAQIIEHRFMALEVSNTANTLRIAQLTMEKEKALIWGVITLGTIVIGMAVWVFNFVIGHAR